MMTKMRRKKKRMMTSKAIYKQRNGLGECKQCVEGGGRCKSGVDLKMSFAWGVEHYQCALKCMGRMY